MAIIADDKVLTWRREQLLHVGFPYDHAHSLAVDSEVDLHVACALAISAGHWVAYRILAAVDPEPEAERPHLELLKEYT